MQLALLWPRKSELTLSSRLRVDRRNLSKEVRAIPGAGFSAPWFRGGGGKSLPRSVWEGLSEKGRHAAREIVRDDEFVDKEWSPDWEIEGRVGGGGPANRRHTGAVLARL